LALSAFFFQYSQQIVQEVDELQQDYLQMRVLELAPQVYVQDLKLIAKQDVRSIMDNRSADEAMRQPLAADLARVAEELGINYVHFPVDPGPITAQAAEAYAKACDALERPLLIFGQSGARSMKIWEMSESI
jgi:sulfide:quinone oxidoreductase